MRLKSGTLLRPMLKILFCSVLVLGTQCGLCGLSIDIFTVLGGWGDNIVIISLISHDVKPNCRIIFASRGDIQNI